MIKRKNHSSKYSVHSEIIHKLSRWQVFWLCLAALLVMGIIGVFAPTALVGLF